MGIYKLREGRAHHFIFIFPFLRIYNSELIEVIYWLKLGIYIHIQIFMSCISLEWINVKFIRSSTTANMSRYHYPLQGWIIEVGGRGWGRDLSGRSRWGGGGGGLTF